MRTPLRNLFLVGLLVFCNSKLLADIVRPPHYTISGYADLGLILEKKKTGFSIGKFAPIFQFFYHEFMLFYANPVFTVTNDTVTQVNLDSFSANFILNDSWSFGIGKTRSLLGQFQKDLSPSWINKLPNAPSGFTEERSVAPLHNIGLELRGSHYFAGPDINLLSSFFVTNGPRLISRLGETRIATDEANGKMSYGKLFGTRLSVIPIRPLSIGVSGAYSRTGLGNEENRLYLLNGVDFVFHSFGSMMTAFEFRGELMRSFVELTDIAARSETAWYLQTSYTFESLQIQPVVRYSELYSTTYEGSANQSTTGTQSVDLGRPREKQTSIGLNYIHHASLIMKFAWNLRDGDNITDKHQGIVQLAIGF